MVEKLSFIIQNNKFQIDKHLKYLSTQWQIVEIRGTCPKTVLLFNSTHHNVCLAVAELFKIKDLEIYEEVHCGI